MSDRPVLLRARTVITDAARPALHDGAVLIQGERIAAVGPYAELIDASSARPGKADVVEVSGTLMPGLIDAHSHLRGMPLTAHGIAPKPLEAWLTTLPAMAALSAADESLVAASDLLQTGITSVQGIVHSFDDAAGFRSLLDETGAGLTAAGIRSLVILGFSDRAERAPQPADGAWALLPGVDHRLGARDFATLASAWLAAPPEGPYDLLRWGVGPVAAQWATDIALTSIAAIAGTPGNASGLRLHTHLNESRWQRTWIAGEQAPVDRLAAAGLFDARLSAAHAVHLTDDEIAAVADAGVVLVHCPASNEALSVGTARVGEWLRRGVTTALGLDSQNLHAPDAFDVMRQALNSAAALNDPITETQIFAMATSGGAAALGVPGLGRITVGAPADVVALDLATTADSAVETLVHEGSAGAVDSVWVAGRLRVAAGRALTDSSSARQRLRQTLDADATARADRLAQTERLAVVVSEMLAEAAR